MKDKPKRKMNKGEIAFEKARREYKAPYDGGDLRQGFRTFPDDTEEDIQRRINRNGY